MPDISSPTITKSWLNSLSKNKKIVIVVVGVIVVAVIGIVAAVLVFNSRNPVSTNINQNGFSYIPDNICPQSIFQENGQTRADVDGKPYIVSDSQKSWMQQNCQNVSGLTSNPDDSSNVHGNSSGVFDETEPPLKLGSIGFNLGDFNSSTNTAGDIVFTKVNLPFDEIYGPFGQQDPRSPNDTTKRNPQPTVILPLGTKVHSLVTGEVVEVKELYSGDMTIWVAKDKKSQYFYETEHVKNPTVAIGDKVTAGQVIGEVSDYDSHNTPGFGLVEIGILHPVPGGGTPEHVCPLKYLDPTIKDTVFSQLTKLYAAWNNYLGKPIYNDSTFVSPGCVVETGVAG